METELRCEIAIHRRRRVRYVLFPLSVLLLWLQLRLRLRLCAGRCEFTSLSAHMCAHFVRYGLSLIVDLTAALFLDPNREDCKCAAEQ